MKAGNIENNVEPSAHDVMRESFIQATYERALLSCALNDIDYFYLLATKINDSDFLHPKHAVIFNTLKVMQDKGWEKFDLDMVTNELQANCDIEFIGGSNYIKAIKNMPVSGENFNKSLDLVLDASTKYQVYCKLKRYMDIIGSKDITGDDIISMIESEMMDLSTESMAIEEPVNIADGLREYIDEKRGQSIEMSGLSTGYPILDRQIDGLIPGTLMIVAARKKMGKSALLTNIAAQVAFVNKVPVLYVDTEMSFNEWRDRVIASMAGVPERTVKHGTSTDVEYEQLIKKCVEKVENGKLFHYHMPGYSIEKISALYKKYKLKEDIGLGIFDYIKEPESKGVAKQRKEHQLLGDVTTRLKDLASTLNIPFLTAAQLNRDGDVADSDRIARYGDIVSYWMKRPDSELDENPNGNYKLVIKDTRRGGMTSNLGITYVFNPILVGIKEISADKQIQQYNLSKEGVLDDINKENYHNEGL